MLIKIILICIITAFLMQLIRQFSPSFMPVVSLSAGVLIIYMLSGYIGELIDLIKLISDNISGLSECIKIAIKAMGISVICEFSSQLCDDMGEKLLSSKIEFAGKIIIICITMPELIKIINMVAELIFIL